MEFSADAIDFNLLELPWRQEGRKLVVSAATKERACQIVQTQEIYDRVAVLVRQAGCEMAQICFPGMKKGFRILAAALDSLEEITTMTSNQSVPIEDSRRDRYVWFGGVITEPLDYHLKRMRDASEPMGLVQPIIQNGILKTIQLGINPASIRLFQFDALSMNDMQSAIQRDTTDDWYPEDLDLKRQLFQQAGETFEQVARIRTKTGWMRMWFGWERIDIADGSYLAIGRGRQESDIVASPDLLFV